MQQHSLKKLASLVASVGGIMLVGVIVFQVGVAFGWTNPTGNPPIGSGIISAANTNIGVNYLTPTTAKLVVDNPGAGIEIDVDPSGAATGRIQGLTATPTAQDEAASVAYVQAQAFGGGGKPMITIWGHYNTQLPPNNVGAGPWAQFWVKNPPSLATIKNCLAGGMNCMGTVNAAVPAGGGLTCPTVQGQPWVSVYSGYGPYVYLDERYFYKVPAATYRGGASTSEDDENPTLPDGEDIPSVHLPSSRVGVTYSVCGQDSYLGAQHNYSVYTSGSPTNTGIGEYAGIMSACMPQPGNTVSCNVCKVCMAP